MSNRELYILGPGPRGRADTTATPSPAFYKVPPLPTEYRVTAHGRVLVANPNRCLICHRERHQDIPHHSFEPELASIDAARALGWPMPPQESLS